jgi:hypothetical protein
MEMLENSKITLGRVETNRCGTMKDARKKRPLPPYGMISKKLRICSTKAMGKERDLYKKQKSEHTLIQQEEVSIW